MRFSTDGCRQGSPKRHLSIPCSTHMSGRQSAHKAYAEIEGAAMQRSYSFTLVLSQRPHTFSLERWFVPVVHSTFLLLFLSNKPACQSGSSNPHFLTAPHDGRHIADRSQSLHLFIKFPLAFPPSKILEMKFLGRALKILFCLHPAETVVCRACVVRRVERRSAKYSLFIFLPVFVSLVLFFFSGVACTCFEPEKLGLAVRKKDVTRYG